MRRHGFREGAVEADGFRIRCMEAGQGTPLVHLHGAGGLRLTRGHDLLARHHRVIAFEMPGFGTSPKNTRTRIDGPNWPPRWQRRSRHSASTHST